MRFGLIFERLKIIGGEMSLRTKGIAIVSVLTSILMGTSGGGFASAATNPAKISDNPDSVQSITLSHVIHNAYLQSNAKVHYEIGWCDTAPALSQSTDFVRISGDLKFVDQGRDENLDSTTSETISFADYEFRAPGTYEFCAYESIGDASGGIPVVDSTQYKIYVDVVNELDGNGNATGNLISTLVPQALNLTTGEKGEIVFESTAQKTSMQFTHNVVGAKADREHYFPYDVSLAFDRFIPRGATFELEGLDASFTDTYTGDMKTNPTVITAGPGKVRVYLKEGQTLRLGKRNGVDDLSPSATVTIQAVSEHALEGEYVTEINGQTKDSISSLLKLPLGENPTEAEAQAYQENNDIKIVRNLQQNAVSTGLVARIMPFVALIFVAGIVGFVAYKSDKNKRARKA